MKQSPSWEANWFSTSQEISHILCKPNVLYRFHKCPPHASILSQINLSMPLPQPTSWRPIFILSSHLRLGLPSGLFPSGFSTKILQAYPLSPTRATCPAHPILFDLISRIIFGEEVRSGSTSLHSFLHSPATMKTEDPAPDGSKYSLNSICP